MDLWLGALGLFVFIYRLGFRDESEESSLPVSSLPLVSIIVPARNEALNLIRLLPSLQALNYPSFEIIVVDDSSTDGTFQIAENFGAKTIRALPRPEGWSGKNWACEQGAQKAQGQLLLFSDADTQHSPDSLRRTVQALQQRKVSLLSVPPYHLCETWWEKLLGLFHLMPLLITAYRHEPKTHRIFSIGQYLLFTREAYLKLDGHRGIASSLTDDIDLACRVLERNLGYSVLATHGIYQVQMYSGFVEFCQGWKRLFRLGMQKTHWLSLLELSLVLYLFLGIASHLAGPSITMKAAALLLLTAAILFLSYRQTKAGPFSFWGALFFPVSLLLFTILSFWAIMDRNLKRPVQWRSRDYSTKATAVPESDTDSKYA